MGERWWKLRRGRGRPQSNIQQTLSCKVPETRPGPAAVPTAASSLGTSSGRAENPTSLTVGSTRDVRRETNLGTCFPLRPILLVQPQYFVFWSAFSIFKRNRTREGMTKGEFEPIYCSRIQLSELTTGRWVRARYISSREHRDQCFGERFLLFFFCVMCNIYPILSFFSFRVLT